MENYTGKCETREQGVGMRIARLCYTGYLTGSSKKNFEREILKSVLNDSMLVTLIIAQNLIQISCHLFLSKLLKGLRVSFLPRPYRVQTTVYISGHSCSGISQTYITLASR